MDADPPVIGVCDGLVRAINKIIKEANEGVRSMNDVRVRSRVRTKRLYHQVIRSSCDQLRGSLEHRWVIAMRKIGVWRNFRQGLAGSLHIAVERRPDDHQGWVGN